LNSDISKPNSPLETVCKSCDGALSSALVPEGRFSDILALTAELVVQSHIQNPLNSLSWISKNSGLLLSPEEENEYTSLEVVVIA
jgi:hypothetical protein